MADPSSTLDASPAEGHPDPPEGEGAPVESPRVRSALGPASPARFRPAAGHPPERLTEFIPPITLLRWGTLAVGIGLAAPEIRQGDLTTIFWGLALLLYTFLRTVRPLEDRGRVIDIVEVVVDTAIHVAAVVATGYWNSAFALSAVNAVVLGGFARGYAFALRLAVASALAVGIPYVVAAVDESQALQDSLAWSAVLVLVAVIAGYSVRVFGVATLAQQQVLGQLDQLAQANELLEALNRVAQTLPASLDEGHVVETLIERVRSLVEVHAIVVVLHEPDADDWRVAAAEGLRLPTRIAHRSLPSAARRAVRNGRPVLVKDSWIEDPGGFSPRCRSALYSPLSIRRDVIGVVAAEATVPEAFTDTDAEWLRGVTEPAALAFSNARLFRRLRAVGAEEERTRIARDLHDRVGQSLAYLAFELDRITARARTDAVVDDLGQLRNDVRSVVSEVRETLYDIRSEVTEDHDMVEVLGQFLERVALRSGLEVSFRHDVTDERLPLRQEREMWRIAQEAVVNAERHAKATAVSVWWRSDTNGGVLDVSDDGTGFLPGVASRLDSYGMVGMRERATAIGARLEIDTAPGRGTTVRCVLDRQ